MESTRTTTIGIGLIMAIFFGWFLLNQSKKPPVPPKPVATDTTARQNPAVDTAQHSLASKDSSRADSAKASSSVFASSSTSSTSALTVPSGEAHIETPLFSATVSGKGGSISSWVLKSFKTWDQKPLQLVNQKDFNGGDVNLKFVGSDGKIVDTKDLPFSVDAKNLRLNEKDSASLKAYYRLDTARYIEKTFTFNGGRYAVQIEYRLVGLQNAIAGYHYSALVENPLPYVEFSSSNESGAALAFAGMKNGTEEINANKVGEEVKKSYNGDVDFVASRTQYFMQALITTGSHATAAEVTGNAKNAADGGSIKAFAIGVTLPLLHTPEESVRFEYYLGPLEYDRVKATGVGLENTMNFGWSFLVRPISIHLMLPLLNAIHSFISNWGLVIILFSIMIKLVTIPLSTGQMKSMRKMQVLQPKVAEVRLKYKEDPKKMNEELLALYRTYGVNPAGGCLPMVFQMPILFALYAVLRNVIELRQAPFAFWIHDLSIPDGLIQFGRDIPLLGPQLSGLTILLGATMLIQQTFTVTDPKQKTMAYLMPVVFTFMFNKLPSGVALYYLMFNLFGLAQQFYITKIAKPITLESIKVDPSKQKKGGGIMAKLQSMEKSAGDNRRKQMMGKK
jgi:YidC/Oxa1 family membrane protein insertase